MSSYLVRPGSNQTVTVVIVTEDETVLQPWSESRLVTWDGVYRVYLPPAPAQVNRN